MLRGGTGRHKLRVQADVMSAARNFAVGNGFPLAHSLVLLGAAFGPPATFRGFRGRGRVSSWRVEHSTLRGDHAGFAAEAFGFGQRRSSVCLAAKAPKRPCAPQMPRCKARPPREDRVVFGECPGRVVPHDGYRRQPEMAFDGLRISPKTRCVRLLGRFELPRVNAHEPERMPHLCVVGSPAGSFLEPRPSPVGFAPASRAHAPFARSASICRRNLGGMIVHFERFFVLVGELVRVSELDEGDRVAFSQLLREPVDLPARGPEVAGQSEHADEEPPAGDVVLVAREVVAKQMNGVSLAMLASE